METSIITISKEMALSNDTLRNIRAEISAEVDKANASFSKLYAKADAVKAQLFKSAGIKLAALPEKLDPEQYDGFKSPLQFAEKGMGFSHSAADCIVKTGRIYADPNYPQAWRDMPPYNLIEVLRADRDEALKATADGTIKADTPQSELVSFKESHKPKESKSGKPVVVTPLRCDTDAGERTEDDWKRHFEEASPGESEVKIFKAAGYVLNPADAPSVKLNVRVYVRFCYRDGVPTSEVKVLTPLYTPDAAKPTDAEKAKAAADAAIITRFIERNKCSREEAVEALKEMGMID